MSSPETSPIITPLHEPSDAADSVRVPPHNYEAEMALLGAILANNRAYERVQDFLRAEHFADSIHGRIYQACERLIDRGQLATPITLKVPDRYVLRPGEFPYCIARRFNIHPADLLQANGLPPGARPPAGTTLVIPKNARPWPDTHPRSLVPHPTTYVTQAGDTLYKIACKFGDVWPEQIAQANNIPLSQMDQPLEPGKKLKIP